MGVPGDSETGSQVAAICIKQFSSICVSQWPNRDSRIEDCPLQSRYLFPFEVVLGVKDLAGRGIR